MLVKKAPQERGRNDPAPEKLSSADALFQHRSQRPTEPNGQWQLEAELRTRQQFRRTAVAERVDEDRFSSKDGLGTLRFYSVHLLPSQSVCSLHRILILNRYQHIIRRSGSGESKITLRRFAPGQCDLYLNNRPETFDGGQASF